MKLVEVLHDGIGVFTDALDPFIGFFIQGTVHLDEGPLDRFIDHLPDPVLGSGHFLIHNSLHLFFGAIGDLGQILRRKLIGQKKTGDHKDRPHRYQAQL